MMRPGITDKRPAARASSSSAGEKPASSSELDTTDGSARYSESSSHTEFGPATKPMRLPKATCYSMQQKPLNKLRMQNKGKNSAAARRNKEVAAPAVDILPAVSSTLS